jgi:hypothetical protein
MYLFATSGKSNLEIPVFLDLVDSISEKSGKTVGQCARGFFFSSKSIKAVQVSKCTD